MSTVKPNCYWCGEPSVTEVLIERERKQTDKRTGVTGTIPAKLAPACEQHRNILGEQPLFYTWCGCTYVEGEQTCPRHNRPLDSISKVRLLSRGSKPTVIGGSSKSVK